MGVMVNGDSLRKVLKFSGDLDRSGVAKLHLFWEEMPGNSWQELALDFSGVGFVGTSGLALLIEMARQCHARGQRVQVIHASPEVLALLASLQMEKVIAYQ